MKRIGLLGGSFNPAHVGHLYISLEAIKRLKLDEVWWVISPSNPLKNNDNIANFDIRLRMAKNLTIKYTKIKISDFEQKNNLCYTIDTIKKLQQIYPYHFIWLMGADNLAIFHYWKNWQQLAKIIPIVIFDRYYNNNPEFHKILRSKMAIRFKKFRNHSKIKFWNDLSKQIPSWQFIFLKPNHISSTKIRDNL